MIDEFVRALRGAEVRVSVAESIEAHQAAALIGFDDRQMLKDSLALICAKSEEEKRRFEDCFDLFFAREALASDADFGPGPAGDGESADGETGDGEAPADAADATEADGEAAPGEGDAPGLAQMLESRDMAQLQAEMQRAADAVGASNARYVSQRGFFARRMLDEIGLRDLERMIAELRRNGDEARADALERGRRFLLQAAGDFVERQRITFAANASNELREEILETARLGSLDQRDYKHMQRLVRRMAKKLATRYARRRRVARRGVLNTRKTIRSSLATDGVPFQVHWKYRKVNRPRVVVICDVSRSVAAVARFLLMFLYNLNDVISDVRAFAFSSNLVDVTATLDELGVDEAIPRILEEIGFRSTDYGQALADFESLWLPKLDRHTAVIIMGDGRSNNTDPRLDIMRKLHDHAGRVIWLNPEPESFWGTGDSEMHRYRPFCQMARVCNTVRHLERAIDTMLKAHAGSH